MCGVLIRGLQECTSSGLAIGAQFFSFMSSLQNSHQSCHAPKACGKTSQGQFGICSLRLFVVRPQLENETLINYQMVKCLKIFHRLNAGPRILETSQHHLNGLYQSP